MRHTKTSIVFTGDIGFDRYMAGKWEDEELISPSLLAFLQSGDHLCINVEGALIDAQDDGTRGVFFHSMNPKAAPFFRKLGANIWSIGNAIELTGMIFGAASPEFAAMKKEFSQR